MKAFTSFQLVSSKTLHKSQPNPYLFGNKPNPQGNEHWTSQNWLTSLFHFSFAEHSNGPQTFGIVRVLNDDVVQPNRGFGVHPHRNMEIVTYVIKGELTHQDSMGTKETIGSGSIQFMSAGSGIQHSEFNESPTDPLRFLQIWILPRKTNLKPAYGSYIPKNEPPKDWRHLVSDVDLDHTTPVKVNQDVNIYVGHASTDPIEFELKEGRQAYMVCFGGTALINNEVEISNQDAGELKGPGKLLIAPTAGTTADFLLIEMKKTTDTRFKL